MAKQFTDAELRKKLTPEQYHILREKGTEPPFSGKYLNHNEKGMYTCAVCGAELFSSDTKYDSTTPGLIGWPSFYDAIKSDAIKLIDDNSLGAQRVEATCANCDTHLGHLFDDTSAPDGKHYCINSASLAFMPADKQTAK